MYNCQNTKVVLLLGESHQKLWDIVMETLRSRVAQEKFGRTEKKIQSFASGRGTVLYFNDDAVVNELIEKFPTYAQTFPQWAQHATGMLQFAIWTGLEDVGYGASIQHYNPIIDEEVKKTFSIPDSWQLTAQMPFGNPSADWPSEPPKVPIEERFLVK